MKASVLAIGTELTSGQITNKNASWLSHKLKSYGLETRVQLTVPDEAPLITQALDFIEAQSDLILVTGGLGPTTDDITRDVLAAWAGKQMKFDEFSWNHIVERLSSRGFQVREMQRQQCFYPENAEILFNSEGTANAFRFTAERPSGTKTLIVLPGPPREIEAIWNAHLKAWFEVLTLTADKRITRAWDTLGKGESDVAHLVEEALKGRPAGEPLEIGYRVHLPYVEVKLGFDQSKALLWAPWVKQVDEALASVTITRDFDDVAVDLVRKLSACDFTFYDFVSEGYLHNRLSPHLVGLKNWSFKQGASAPTADFFEGEEDFLALLPFEESQSVVVYSVGGVRKQKTLEAPMKAPQMSERRRQYFAELALVELWRG